MLSKSRPSLRTLPNCFHDKSVHWLLLVISYYHCDFTSNNLRVGRPQHQRFQTMVSWHCYFCPAYGRTESIMMEKHAGRRWALHLRCDQKQGQRARAQAKKYLPRQAACCQELYRLPRVYAVPSMNKSTEEVYALMSHPRLNHTTSCNLSLLHVILSGRHVKSKP